MKTSPGSIDPRIATSTRASDIRGARRSSAAIMARRRLRRLAEAITCRDGRFRGSRSSLAGASSLKLRYGLRRAKRRPRKQRQTQIDRRRVQRIHDVGKIEIEAVLSIQRPRLLDEMSGERRVNSPITLFVGVRQRRTAHGTAKAHVIQLGRLRGLVAWMGLGFILRCVSADGCRDYFGGCRAVQISFQRSPSHFPTYAESWPHC